MNQPRPLGTSNVSVTPVIFGAWAIGGWMWGGSDDQASIDAIRASIDHGVTTIDTAAIYGMGYSEELVAKAIKGYPRDKVVIATKCGMRWDVAEGSQPWAHHDNQGNPVTIYKNSRPHSIQHECEKSLKRLGVDVIDLYQIHWPDESTPVEESMEAMLKLQRQGKIKAIGVSNYDAAWLEAARKIAPIASLQPPYSLIQRAIEAETLPYCRKHNIGVIVYSPMERGLLTGKIGPEREFPAGDHRNEHPFFSKDNRRRVQNALEQLRGIADKHKASFAQLVIAWTFHEPGITAALVGARNAEQAVHNAQALRITLTNEERAQIRKAFDDVARDLMPQSPLPKFKLNSRAAG